MSSTPRGKRQKIAPGIYRDAYGISVFVRIGSGKNERRSPEIRFPLDTALDVLTLRRDREKVKLREGAARGATVTRGTLSADVPLYLKAAQLSPLRVKERTQQLKWWVARLGHRSRHALTWQEIRDALATLKGTASTKNKYRTALSNLYTVLDGKNASNPVRDVPRLDEPEAERRDQPYELIRAILAKLRDRGRGHAPSKTKAILRVLAHAPVTPAQLWKLWPDAVHWTEAELTTPGRKKGTGTMAQRKPLTPEAIEAFRAFDAAGCWGHQPSRSSIRRIFRAARDAAIQELRVTTPALDLSRAATMRPYDLRHSFATLVLQQTGSLDMTGKMLGHAPGSKTTIRYAQGAVPALLKVAGEQITRGLAAIPPYVPPPQPAAPVDFHADFHARAQQEPGDFHARLPRATTDKTGKVWKFPVKSGIAKTAGSRGSQAAKPPKHAK